MVGSLDLSSQTGDVAGRTGGGIVVDFTVGLREEMERGRERFWGEKFWGRK